MKILIAVDSSKIADKAFDWYVSNLHKDEDEIFLCHEAEQPNFPPIMFTGAAGVFPPHEIDRYVEEHRKRCQLLRNHYTTKCSESKLRPCEILITVNVSKNPGQGIVERAEEVGAEMIIMGTRGHGTIRRTILGSVSDYVLHHAKSPVVICH